MLFSIHFLPIFHSSMTRMDPNIDAELVMCMIKKLANIVYSSIYLAEWHYI